MKDTYSTTKNLILSALIPEATRTYRPISNLQLIDTTLECIEKAGFVLDREYYSSAKEGMVSTGEYTIANVADTEMQLKISWRNSYDKSLSLNFSVGVMIKVCSNGLCKSLNTSFFKKKHQGTIQSFAPEHICEYIMGANGIFREIQKERDEMKEVELSKRIQAEIIGRMFIEEDFVRSTQLNLIKKELESPTYNYGDPSSLWSLYQYTTSAMRELHPSLKLQDHLEAHRFFTDISTALKTIKTEPTENVFPIPLILRDTMTPIEDPRIKQLSLYD